MLILFILKLSFSALAQICTDEKKIVTVTENEYSLLDFYQLIKELFKNPYKSLILFQNVVKIIYILLSQ